VARREVVTLAEAMAEAQKQAIDAIASNTAQAKAHEAMMKATAKVERTARAKSASRGESISEGSPSFLPPSLSPSLIQGPSLQQTQLPTPQPMEVEQVAAFPWTPGVANHTEPPPSEAKRQHHPSPSEGRVQQVTLGQISTGREGQGQNSRRGAGDLKHNQ
jgi:hypothetical protein